LADFIKTKEKLFALEKEILEDKLSLQNQIKGFDMPKADSMLTDILVSAAEMKARIEKVAPDMATHPEVRSLDLKSQVLQSELEIEKSELPEDIFNKSIPVTIDQNELSKIIKEQDSNEFVSLSERYQSP
jgi:hypothetical protein